MPAMEAPPGPVSEAEWAGLRAEALRTPAVSEGAAGAVLLPYQRRLLEAIDAHDVVVMEKSRRIGATWGVGAQGALLAGAARQAGGMDVLYIGYNLDMAREFIDVAAMWARSFALAAGEVGEFLLEDQDSDGHSRHIQAYRIRFASGFELVALASRPRSLRGRQGFVIIDEAAFHDDLEGVLKAAMAFLVWGGKVLVISTHDGDENPFAELVKDIRAGKRPYALLRTDFDEAIQDGLYQRVCLVRRREWTLEGEAAWRAQIRAFYGEGAAEELDVIPRAGGQRYLPLALIEARASRAVPVLRLALPDSFLAQPEHARDAGITAWCEAELGPRLRALNPLLRSAFGQDFARKGDLSVIWPVQVLPDLTRAAPFTVEMRNVPFDAQRQVLFYILDRLPRLSAGAMDATGNGSYLAEKALLRYGAHRIEGINLTEGWYRDHMPRLKAAFEDGTIVIPADAGTVEDFRQLTLVRGVARVPDRRTVEKGEDKDKSGAGAQRHGDAAIAAALAIYAASRDVADGTADALPQQSPVPPGLADFMGVGRLPAIGDFLG
jgi:phage FluMu gp28-like protein